MREVSINCILLLAYAQVEVHVLGIEREPIKELQKKNNRQYYQFLCC